jgi:hypothetical protein
MHGCAKKGVVHDDQITPLSSGESRSHAQPEPFFLVMHTLLNFDNVDRVLQPCAHPVAGLLCGLQQRCEKNPVEKIILDHHSPSGIPPFALH